MGFVPEADAASPQPDLESCINSCATLSTDQCVGVHFVHGFLDYEPGTCFYHTSYGSYYINPETDAAVLASLLNYTPPSSTSTGLSSEPSTTELSSTLEPSSTIAPPSSSTSSSAPRPTCPEGDGSTYTESDGSQFLIVCNQGECNLEPHTSSIVSKRRDKRGISEFLPCSLLQTRLIMS